MATRSANGIIMICAVNPVRFPPCVVLSYPEVRNCLTAANYPAVYGGWNAPSLGSPSHTKTGDGFEAPSGRLLGSGQRHRRIPDLNRTAPETLTMFPVIHYTHTLSQRQLNAPTPCIVVGLAADVLSFEAIKKILCKM